MFYRKILYILFFYSLILGKVSYAQLDVNTLNYRQLKSVARVAENKGDIYTSIDCYERLCKENPKDIYNYFKLAEFYRLSRDYSNASIWFRKAYEGDPKKFTIALYYYALMLKYEGQYEEAIKYFEKFRKASRGKKNYKIYSKFVKNDIAGCEIAASIIDTPINTDITHLDSSINKAYIELSPIILNDSTLIYASLKSDEVSYYDANDKETRKVGKFYTAQKVDKDWIGGALLQGPFNKEFVTTGNGTFTQNGNRFYFTRCEPNVKGKLICAIFLSKKINGKWQEPIKLGKHINNPDYTSTQPTVAKESKRNQEILYFVSDRPGGRGGMDIWYTIFDYTITNCSEPKNAGGKINTIGDEVTPFYDMDTRSLYFSSTGWPGIGGFDIFKANGEIRKWTNLQNVGYPINSKVDDLYYILNKYDKSQGFFASNRAGGVALKHETCCDDLYSFKLNDYINIAISGKIFTVKGSDTLQYIEKILDSNIDTIDEKNKIYLESASVTLYMKDKNNQIYVKKDITESDGKYFLTLEQGNDYFLNYTKEGYFSKHLTLDTKEIRLSDTIEKDVMLMKIPKKPIIVKNIYYPYNESFLTDSAKIKIDTTLLRLLKENPQLIIEISSHTDSKGTDDYNVKLSERRAKSVVDYLINNNISKESLVSKGYGESMPIAPNDNPDGTDNPEGRQKNRRTEFKVIGTLDKYSEIIYEE